MPTVDDVIRTTYAPVIAMTDMNAVSEGLRRIAAEPGAGLGVAILVAWQHGLRIGHIPLEYQRDGTEKESQHEAILAGNDCPYMFVHVPVRKFRGDKPKLAELGIMSRDADPALFIYHEDGLIGTFSFGDLDSAGLTEPDAEEILEVLAQQGVLIRANINNRQIQFKDLAAKRRIEESGKDVYVRVVDRPLDDAVALPAELSREDVRDYVFAALRDRSACNYCSVQALNPREVTMHSARMSRPGRGGNELATVRNYQLGFTFAPFGDPRKICHFLAWDFPHINDLVMNMEPQSYSFSDLIRLVRVINRDIERFCDASMEVDRNPEPISGACNHWAGNSIYHQHYQFLRSSELPLMRTARSTGLLAAYKDIEVRKFTGWPAPAFLITSARPGRDEEVMRVADRVAREWHMLSSSDDRSYGNGIAIKNHTQNIFVTTAGNRVLAVFIPRDRHKIRTTDPDNLIQKKNAGVLEMMGYFIIDDDTDFGRLRAAPRGALKSLGDSWLAELSPDAEPIREFEASIRICLSEAVGPYESRIDELAGDPAGEAWTLASSIRRDASLDHPEREHLYRELLATVLAAASGSAAAPRRPRP